MKLGILLSQVRLEEKMIFAAAERAGVDVVKVFDKELILDIEQPEFPDVDLVLDRGLVHSRAEYTLRFLRDFGIPTINSYQATLTCDNKYLTTMTLRDAGIPQLRTKIAYTPRSALQAIEQLGYPVVLKPPVGSWGRLRLNNIVRDDGREVSAPRVATGDGGSPGHGAERTSERSIEESLVSRQVDRVDGSRTNGPC